ncbi:MAG: class II aldolase/adducin family protein [Victivallales bacterium]|nr:class II aldolase/adducin family protein [Victivallales bacterium]
MKNLTFMHPRDQIVEIMRRIYGNGLTTTSGGNLSIVDADGNLWISPASIDKGTLRREDIMCVKKDGSIVGPHRPSSEYPFHNAIYRLRPDVRAILHAHPPTLVSFSVAGKIPDAAVFPNAKTICGTVGYAPYEVPGSEALGSNVSAAFAAGHSTILLENHGTCCAGSTLLQAFQRFETLDFCARLISNAQQLGTPTYLTDTQLEYHAIDRNIDFQEFIPSNRSSEEMELRYQMSLLIQRAYRQQLFTSTEGTFACRLDKDSFLITQRSVDRGTIQPEDLVLVKGNQREAGKRLSRGAWFMKAIFDAQPEINSLILASPPNVMAYAVTHEAFDPRVIPESYILLREVPTFPFGAHFGDVGEITRTLSPRYPVVMIQNDCLVTSGKTLLEAFDRLEVAEYSARSTIACKALGGMKPISDDQIADLIKAFKLPE